MCFGCKYIGERESIYAMRSTDVVLWGSMELDWTQYVEMNALKITNHCLYIKRWCHWMKGCNGRKDMRVVFLRVEWILRFSVMLDSLSDSPLSALSERIFKNILKLRRFYWKQLNFKMFEIQLPTCILLWGAIRWIQQKHLNFKMFFELVVF